MGMGQAVDVRNQTASKRRQCVFEFSNGTGCLASAFHRTPHVQTVTSFDSGHYLYVNDNFVTAAGYAREEVIGKTSSEIGIVADKFDRRWFTDVLRQHGRFDTRKVRFRLRSGDVRLGLFDAEVIKVDGQDCILSTVRNVTDASTAEDRQGHITYLNRAAELAHEIRNPLASIKGVADAFLQRGQLSRQEREWMEAVRHEVLKIDARLRELLDVSQPRVFNIKPCLLSEIVSGVVLLASSHVKSINEQTGKKISIRFSDETTEPLVVHLDPDRIEDAVLNLVLNAIEAIENSGRVTVCLKRLPRSGEAAIEVSDTGSGIPSEIRHRIFEPRFTTKRDGTGLGLAAVRRTASAYHGRITFNTRLGRGTKFVLTLPLRTQQNLNENPT